MQQDVGAQLGARLLQADDQVLNFVKQQNRPFNVQIITDNLAQYGIKKGQVQRAVESLAEAQKLICKVI